MPPRSRPRHAADAHRPRSPKPSAAGPDCAVRADCEGTAWFDSSVEYDAVNAYDLVFCEIRQQLESGHDLGEAEAELAESDPTDRLGLLALYDRVAASPMRPGWAYDEPSEALAVLATLPPARPPAPVDEDDYDRKVHGGWLGRVAGCNLGKPVEDGEHWTSARLREYLGRARAYPLRD